MQDLMPVLFIGHGSPMNAIADTAFTAHLAELGKSLPRPRAILSISAHWVTEGTKVLHHPNPPTIHDFYGFPQTLLDVEYPAAGAPELAKLTHKLIPHSELVSKWGLDHGTWSVLVHMYPDADIPVYQLSLDAQKSNQEHLETAQLLHSLRSEGVLILGSGNIVHNLGLIQWRNQNGGEPWAQEFDNVIKSALENRSDDTLVQFYKLGDIAHLSAPTDEHYLPLLYAYGASKGGDKISYPHEGFELGSLSMRCVRWG